MIAMTHIMNVLNYKLNEKVDDCKSDIYIKNTEYCESDILENNINTNLGSSYR